MIVDGSSFPRRLAVAGAQRPQLVGALVSFARVLEPDALPAATTNVTGQTVTRNLCRFPLAPRYTGHGDPHSAASYICV